jgi:hypothetical protein
MLMRFRGGGVGHKSTRDATRKFLEDRDPLDRITPAAPNEVTDSESEQDGEDGEDAPVAGEEMMDGIEGDEDEDVTADGNDDMQLDSEMDEYGYGGLDQEEEQTDDEDDEDNGDENDGLDADDDLGPEDGEDDADDDLEGYGDL